MGTARAEVSGFDVEQKRFLFRKQEKNLIYPRLAGRFEHDFTMMGQIMQWSMGIQAGHGEMKGFSI